MKDTTIGAMLKAILFDMDGTLVDSETTYVKAVCLCVAAYGGHLEKDEAMTLVYGRSRSMISADIVEQFSQLAINKEQLEEEIDQRFEAMIEHEDIAIESSCAVLRELSKEYPIAVVSGSTRAHIANFTKRADVDTHIQFYIGADDYEYGKPDPSCYLMAAQQFNVEPQHCLVFEDSHVGVRSAKAAGMPCVALRRPGAIEQDVSMADVIVANLNEFELSSIYG